MVKKEASYKEVMEDLEQWQLLKTMNHDLILVKSNLTWGIKLQVQGIRLNLFFKG